MKNPIYVLVEVHYDYYRFQENLFASTNPSECRKFAAKLNSKKVRFEKILDVLDYKKEPKSLRECEAAHYWIQCLTNN